MSNLIGYVKALASRLRRRRPGERGERVSRKKCVMIVGDGFSRSLRNHLGVQHKIITSHLLPCPVEVGFVPEEGDEVDAGPLWRAELFPLLLDEWERFDAGEKDLRKRSYDFFGHLASREVINTSKDKQSWTIYSPSAHIQLRAYLWYLFRHYEAILSDTLRELDEKEVGMWEAWEWSQPLWDFGNYFETEFVSFNYDTVLERALYVLGSIPVCPTTLREASLGLKEGRVRVLKPHGSITFMTRLSFMGEKLRTPWLREYMLGDATFEGSTTWVEPNPTERPLIFDIVPPGHTPRHLANPVFELQEACQRRLSEADVVVLCGLSACAPDTPEVEQLLSRLRADCIALHIGLGNDFHNDAGQLLRKYCQRYGFIDVSKTGLDKIPVMLSTLASH